MRGIITPAVQWPAEALEIETSQAALPIPQAMALELSAHVANYGGEPSMVNEFGEQLPP